MRDLLKEKFHIRGPFRFTKNLWKRLKYSYQRARRGWADCDAWDISNTLEDIAEGMLRYMAAHHMGYPDLKMGSNDEWTAKLVEIADELRAADTADIDERNIYWQQISKLFDWSDHNDDYTHRVEVPDALRDKWLAENKRLAAECDEHARRAYEMLYEYRSELWD